jgi:hypothetical protein
VGSHKFTNVIKRKAKRKRGIAAKSQHGEVMLCNVLLMLLKYYV